MKSIESAIYISSSVFVTLYILGLQMNNEMRYSFWLWFFPLILLVFAFISSDYFVKRTQSTNK